MPDFGLPVITSIHILDLFIVKAAMLVGWQDHWIHTLVIIQVKFGSNWPIIFK
jgi:hypothetical protein